MSGETQWNKKIDFSPKEETIAEPSATIQEGFEEVDEMVQKLKDMRNQKKGFTKLPFLESIYDSIIGSEPEPEPETEPMTDKVGPVIEGMTETTSDYLKTIRYMSYLTYNVSFDVFAYAIITITSENQPKFPGKEPKAPPKNASPDAVNNYKKDKETYDKARQPYNDKKRIADMFNRIFACIISIFIAYNLYYSYSTPPPPTPGEKPIFEKINDWIEDLPSVMFPVKCAVTPVNYFLKLMSMVNMVMSKVPYQPLLFGLCVLIAYCFVNFGVARYFINMGMSLFDPVGSYGNTKNEGDFAKNHSDDVILMAIILICVMTHVFKLCVDFKNPLPATQPQAVLGWLAVFGVALLFIPAGKVAISLILFYICMFSMTKDPDNGINMFKTMANINEKLIGKQVIYECADDDYFRQFLKLIDKIISTVLVENLYAVMLIPIALYNIKQSDGIENLYASGFSKFVFAMLIIVLLATNDSLAALFNLLFKSMKVI